MLMWCFFIAASKDAIFLKHLDSSWLSFPQKLQWCSVFFPFCLDPLSFFKEGAYWEGLWPLLFGLLLRKFCFLGGLDFSFYWDNNAFLDVSALLTIPIWLSLSCSLIKESQKDSRVECRYKNRICKSKFGKNMINTLFVFFLNLAFFT